LTEKINQKKRVRLDHFTGSSSTFLVAELSSRYDQIVVIHPDREAAEFMKADMDQLNLEHAHLFPATGHKPYDDQQITDSSLIVQRSEVLEAIQSSPETITITSAGALFEKIISPEDFASAALT